MEGSMKLPLVSIIVPIYKTNIQYVKECLNSVVKQTYPKDKMEIVICVDGNDEKYNSHLNDVMHKIDKVEIKVIPNEKHYGLGVSRNKAIEASRGDWILILDSDDILEKTAIEKLIKNLLCAFL